MSESHQAEVPQQFENLLDAVAGESESADDLLSRHTAWGIILPDLQRQSGLSLRILHSSMLL